MSVRDRLINFYLEHNPEKLCTVDVILESFEGREDTMFEELEKKYSAVRPAVVQDTVFSTHVAEAHASAGLIRSQFEKLQRQLTAVIQFETYRLVEGTPRTDDKAPEGASNLAFLSSVTTFQNLAANFVEDCIPIVDQLEKLEMSNSTHSRHDGASKRAHSEGNAARGLPLAQETQHAVEIVPAEGTTSGRNIITDMLNSNRIRTGDVLTLHPGTYYENMCIHSEMSLEVRPSFAGATVFVVPLNQAVPCLSIQDNGRIRMTGIVVAQQKSSGRDAVPLISLTNSASCELERCTMVGGGGAVVANGNSTVIMSHSTLRDAIFAAVYLKGGAFGSISNTEFSSCEVGLRVRDSSFSLMKSEIRQCSSDGVTCHGTVQGVVDGSKIHHCKDNGLMLSPGSAVMISGCTILNNEQYGVYAPTGADFAVIATKLTDNVLGQHNRPPPAFSLVHK